MFGKGGGGRRTVVMHYDGIKWSFVDTGNLQTNLFRICYDNSKKKYYINGEEAIWDTSGTIPCNTNNINKIYEFDGKNMKEIYSSDQVSRYISELNGTVYFISENKLWTYSNNSFQVKQDY
jgi:hypothetical protein